MRENLFPYHTELRVDGKWLIVDESGKVIGEFNSHYIAIETIELLNEKRKSK